MRSCMLKGAANSRVASAPRSCSGLQLSSLAANACLHHRALTSRSASNSRTRHHTHRDARVLRTVISAAAGNGSSGAAALGATASVRPIEELKGLQPNDPVVLWFKHDLRIDDHPGLAAAAYSGSRTIVPLYVLDPERLAYLAYTPAGPEVLWAALTALRGELRALGSDLVVRTAPWGAAALAGAAAPLGGGVAAVVSEQEVEYRWRAPAAAALSALAAAGGRSQAQAYEWDAPLWPAGRFEPSFKPWRLRRGRPLEPVDAPPALPPLPAGVEPGDIPSPEELHALIAAAAEAHAARAGGAADADAGLLHVARRLAADANAGAEAARTRRVYAAAAGTLDLLRQYLQASDGTSTISPAASGASATSLASTSIDEEVAALRAPGADGAPFTGLFATAKALGTLSARRVFKEAYASAGVAYGSVPPQSLRRAHSRTAALAAEASSFHRALAQLDESRTIAPGVDVHFWRWRGGLTDYCCAEPAEPRQPGSPPRPAVLLVHGFGAFGDQWRGNVAALAAAGFRVFAPTFPGFGRSQKSAVPYSQDLWRDFLRDFVAQVVGEPVVVAGNSIGGFISSALAADYPQLVKGVVLLNSAGPIDPAFDLDAWRQAVAAGRKAPPAFVVSAVSQALFWYLERSVPRTLRWLYPTNPDKADQWLATEILRAAGDSGAVDVFKSAWYLPPPRALNHLIKDGYGGPAMVLQGALDPLNDARGRARQMGDLCPNVEVVLLEAGHCPHDEVPDDVNRELIRFINTRIVAAAAGSGSSGNGTADSEAAMAKAGATASAQ